MSRSIEYFVLSMEAQCRKIQVAKRLQQEQDDKDLLILLGDIPAHKVSCKCENTFIFSAGS